MNAIFRVFALTTSLLVGISLLTGCGKKSDAELDKKAEELGEQMGNKIVLDMTKKQLAEGKKKFAAKEPADEECSGLTAVKSDLAKDKSPEAASVIKEIDVFCQLDVKVGARVNSLKEDFDKMMAAQKKKDKSSEQLYWAGFSTGCESIKRDFDSLKEDKLENEPKAKELKGQVDQMCTPANVARKKYFT